MLENKKIIQYIYWFCVAALMLFGLWLRADKLGEINFQNDEFFHVDTAKGYLETGRFIMWDFLKNEPTGDYIRAFPYTWLVAQSFKLFGISEWAGRLPSVFFGLLLLPLIFWLSLKISKNKAVALMSLFAVVFENTLIWSSRTCRMYSMFVFFAVLTTYLIYKGLEGKNNKLNFYYLISGGILLIFSYALHEAVLLLGLGFLLYFIINIKQKKYQVLSALSLLILLTFFIFNFFVIQLTTNDFFTLRTDPNFIYFSYPFNQWHVGAVISWLVMILGLFLWSKRENIKIYYYSLFVPIIIFFVFFAARYPAKKYILFLIPFIFILYSDSLYSLCKKIFCAKYFYYALLIIFIIIGPKFIFSYEYKEAHDFKSTYAYLESNYKKDEPVLMQGMRTYYLVNSEINYISLKANKEFTLAELKENIDSNETGWVIWPKFKQYHLRDDFVLYCQKNLDYIEELSDTNMVVYRWGYK
jgi:4-amino-4-deoxy-L-arabinose transferase-like glycosyltransferase